MGIEKDYKSKLERTQDKRSIKMLGEERNLITIIKRKKNNWKDEDTEGEDGSRC